MIARLSFSTLGSSPEAYSPALKDIAVVAASDFAMKSRRVVGSKWFNPDFAGMMNLEFICENQ
jgi:hypothetical protein